MPEETLAGSGALNPAAGLAPRVSDEARCNRAARRRRPPQRGIARRRGTRSCASRCAVCLGTLTAGKFQGGPRPLSKSARPLARLTLMEVTFYKTFYDTFVVLLLLQKIYFRRFRARWQKGTRQILLRAADTFSLFERDRTQKWLRHLFPTFPAILKVRF